MNYELICCAVSKHEGRYLKHWIDWHHRLGIEKFVIYDEGSEHLALRELQDYCWNGLVEYVPATTHPVQYQAYANCASRYAGRAKWILYIDIDEFVNPYGLESMDLKLWLRNYEYRSIAGVAIAWHCFGSNAENIYTPHPVWERITQRVDYEGAHPHSKHIKSFMRPEFISEFNDPHWIKTKPGFVTVDPNMRVITISEYAANDFPVDKIVLNHYSTKTKEEWLGKFARGSADSGPDAYNARKMEDFDRHMLACTRDDKTILEVAAKIGLYAPIV